MSQHDFCFRFEGTWGIRGDSRPARPLPPQPQCIILVIRLQSSQAIVLPGAGDLRAGFLPDCFWEDTEINLRPTFCFTKGRFRCLPGISLGNIRPGGPIYGPEALLHNAT
jgi:hypothetical protein